MVESRLSLAAFALVIALAFTLGACTTVENSHLPNGVAVNKVTCTLSNHTLARCYQAAGEICGPRGYTVYHWDGTPWAKPYPDPAYADIHTMLRSTTLLMACHTPA